MKLLLSNKLWLRPDEIAKELNLGRSTTYDMIAAGCFGIPVRLSDRRGGGLRVHRDGVIRFIERSRAAMSEELGVVE